MAETAVKFLMEKLKQVINGSNDLNVEEKDQLESLYEELGLLRSSIEGWEEELRTLERRIIDLADDVIGLFIGERKDNTMTTDHPRRMMLQTRVFGKIRRFDLVRQEIDAIKTEVMKNYDKKIHDTVGVQVGDSSKRDSSRANTATCGKETMVGFENEGMILKEGLTRGPKQREIISIVGMGGLGKTTLARKVYNDPLVVYHFHRRSWIPVSEEYRKRDLLIGLVSSVIQRPNEIDRMSDSELAQLLYKNLKWMEYFIVLDDYGKIGPEMI